MLQEKYGFVYIWYDRKHKRYYIGSHWGYETDRYICSSRWMRKSYKRRPQDFKRRIIKRIYSDRKKLLDEEQRYLQMIKPEEIKKRYYNLNLKTVYSVHKNYKHSEETKKKISEKCKGYPSWAKGLTFSKEYKQKLSESHKGYIMPQQQKDKISESNKGHLTSQETKEKISITKKGKKHSEETKRKMSEAKIGKTRKPHSEETKRKMSEAKIGKCFSEEHKKKLSEKRKNTKMTTETKLKISKTMKQRFQGISIG